jgi:hypothetical protein
LLNLFFANEKGLIEELWEYFVDTYFSADVPYLENYSLGTGALVTLQGIIIGLTLGMAIATIGTVYSKRHLGDFIRKLMYEECFDKESAKTLSELGYLKDPGVRGAVKSRGSLWRWARCVEEDEFFKEIELKKAEFDNAHKGEKNPPKFKAPEFKRDVNTMHFYLPEEKKYAAETKFDAKGANLPTVLIVSLLSLILCAFACYILPDVLKLIDNFIGIMGK